MDTRTQPQRRRLKTGAPQSERSGMLAQMDKTLYLLRHAKSSWENPTLADRDRPLASRGRRASRVIADHLRSQRITPALVLCSSSARTRETLERVSAGLSDEIAVRIEAGLYTASADDLLDRLHEIDTGVDSVMLIGHNPALQELALSLAGNGADLKRLTEKFPTASLATLAFGGGWRELTIGAVELVAFVTPRELVGSPS
jgi:phosphohistidine phosphatase